MKWQGEGSRFGAAPFLMGRRKERQGERGEGVTAMGMAVPQRWRLVRMGDGWGRARIGAIPYDHAPCGGGFVEMACSNVVYYIDSMVGCYN